MQVIEVRSKSQIKKFVNMPDEIYAGDKFFVPFMRKDLSSTLGKLDDYTVLAVEEDGKYLARIVFTVAPSKQLKLEKCGFFSHFECVNDFGVSRLILSAMFDRLRARGVTHVEGTYFPFDQDNRRGILFKGFECEPVILNSYNPPYYNDLLVDSGMVKDFDTVSYKFDYDRFDRERIDPIVKWVLERYGLYVTCVDFKRLDKEIDDAHAVIKEATNDIIFQEAPTRESLYNIVEGWKSFLWEDLIFFCRRKEDDKPIGFLMGLPNYYTVFRAMNGKSNLFALLKAAKYLKHINSVRVILQYVIPEYQGKAVNFALYNALCAACKAHDIDNIEAGTIMENNAASRLNVERAGGRLNKIFRIYGRDL